MKMAEVTNAKIRYLEDEDRVAIVLHCATRTDIRRDVTDIGVAHHEVVTGGYAVLAPAMQHILDRRVRRQRIVARMRLVHRRDRRRRRGREPAIVIGRDRHAVWRLDQKGGMAEIGDRYLTDHGLSLGGSNGREAGEGRLRYGFCNRLALTDMAGWLLRMRDRRPERVNEPDGGERVDKVPEHQPSPLSLAFLTSGPKGTWQIAVAQRMEAFAFARPDDGVTGRERIVQGPVCVQLQTAARAHICVTALGRNKET
ncbi:hypothetical protein D9M72_476660 [compost metagenome]